MCAALLPYAAGSRGGLVKRRQFSLHSKQAAVTVPILCRCDGASRLAHRRRNVERRRRGRRLVALEQLLELLAGPLLRLHRRDGRREQVVVVRAPRLPVALRLPVLRGLADRTCGINILL